MGDGGLSAVAGWMADSCWGSRIKLFAPGPAGEAARSSPRKLFERCHGLAMFVLWRMGGVDRDCGRGHPFFPAMAGCEIALIMFSHMGWVGFSTAADEATHLYPHFVVPWG